MKRKCSSPAFLGNEELGLIFFVGKGGSGKTTASAACSLYHQSLGKKVLVISIDPAHSLGDVFGQKLSPEVREVESLRGLFAREINGERVLTEFNQHYQSSMRQAIERGTYLDSFDIDNLFSLSLPGLDEVAAILEIMTLVKKREYDLIIVDTAPTGHTLAFLSLHKKFHKWIEILNLMQNKYRFMVKQFTGRYKEDGVDDFIKEIEQDLNYLSRLLSNQGKCAFVPVVNLEPLSLNETDKLLTELKKYNIFVEDIILNRVNINQKCPLCQAQNQYQEKHIPLGKGIFRGYNLVKVPLFPYEIQGVKKLKQFEEVLAGKPADFSFKYNRKLERETSSSPKINYPAARLQGIPSGKFVLRHETPQQNCRVFDRKIKMPPSGIKFIFFGGKGGVGKTTLAASAGLFIALKNQEEKVLVVSCDPAHSLKDAFNLDSPASEEVKINDNLYILELNAPLLFENYKNEYRKNLEEIFGDFLQNGLEVKFDREIMRELIDFSPPGIDEIMALTKLIDFLEEKKFGIYIIDTAATGHLLRLMELPGVIKEWNKIFLRMLLKYKISSLTLKEKALDFLKKVKRIGEILKDQNFTQFFVLTIAEAAVIAETERLLSSLKNLSVSCRNIIVNFIFPESKCDYCSIKRAEQRKYLDEFIKQRSTVYNIAVAPLKASGINGIEGLKKLGQEIFSFAN